jgi:hypothetical protein
MLFFLWGAKFERMPYMRTYCAPCLHKAHGRHAPAQKCLHLSCNTTTELGAFPLNLFLFCALLTSTTCLHMHYTGTKHMYKAAKEHVTYIAHRRVLCTALKHIMIPRMPICKGPFIFPVAKKIIPYRCLHLISPQRYIKKDLSVSVGH